MSENMTSPKHNGYLQHARKDDDNSQREPYLRVRWLRVKNFVQFLHTGEFMVDLACVYE